MKNNPVAKNAHKFNKASVQKDRKKALKKGDRKHKGRYEDSGDIEERSTLDAISSVLRRGKDKSKYQAAVKAVKSGEYTLSKAAQVFGVRDKVLQDLVAEGNMKENGKGLWANIRAKRARGEKPAKPGDKDYPKTLEIEGKNTPGDGNPCWDTHKKVGTKMKNGKRVNDCVPKNEGVEEGMYKSGNKGSRKLGTRKSRVKSSKDQDKYGPVDYDAKKAKTRRKIDNLKHKRELDKLNKDFDYDFDEGTSAQSRLDRAMSKRGLGKPNTAASDYEAKLMKKYGAKDMADLKKKMGMKETMDPRDYTDKPGYVVVVKNKKGEEEIKHYSPYKPHADRYARRVHGGPDKATVYKTDGRKIMKEEVLPLSELTQKDLERIANRKKKNLVKRGKAKPEPKKPRKAGAGRVSNVGAGKEEADDNVIMQLRKAKDLKGRHDIKFQGGKTQLPINVINKLLATHDKLKKPADKKKLITMITHELRKRSGLKDKPKATSSDKAMDKFNKSRKRGIPAPRGKGSGPSDKELQDIDRGK